MINSAVAKKLGGLFLDKGISFYNSPSQIALHTDINPNIKVKEEKAKAGLEERELHPEQLMKVKHHVGRDHPSTVCLYTD